MPGGYCLDCDDGWALTEASAGVWECGVCGRRAPEVSGDVDDALELGSVSCPSDGQPMVRVRADLYSCRTCGHRVPGASARRDPSLASRFSSWLREGRKKDIPARGGVTAVAMSSQGAVWIGVHDRSLVQLVSGRATRHDLPRDCYVAAVACGPGEDVHVADSGRGRVLTVEAGVGHTTERRSLGRIQPVAMCVDSTSALHVLDGGQRYPEIRILTSEPSEPITLNRAANSTAMALTSLLRGEDAVLVDGGCSQVLCVSRRGREWWTAPGASDAGALAGARAVALVPDSDCLAVACGGGNVGRVVFLDAVGEVVKTVGLPYEPSSLAVSADGALMVVGDADEPRIWVYSRSVKGAGSTRAPSAAESESVKST